MEIKYKNMWCAANKQLRSRRPLFLFCFYFGLWSFCSFLCATHLDLATLQRRCSHSSGCSSSPNRWSVTTNAEQQKERRHDLTVKIFERLKAWGNKLVLCLLISNVQFAKLEVEMRWNWMKTAVSQSCCQFSFNVSLQSLPYCTARQPNCAAFTISVNIQKTLCSVMQRCFQHHYWAAEVKFRSLKRSNCNLMAKIWSSLEL